MVTEGISELDKVAEKRANCAARNQMTKIRTVVLYGNSLALSSIGASLRESAGLKVLPLDAILPDATEQLSSLHPDVVIFDLITAQPDFDVALWKARLDVLLIGVDMRAGKALVLSVQPTRVLTTDDLLQVIEGHASGLEEENA